MTTADTTIPMPGRDTARDRRAIRAWLAIVALMIVAMVVVGGATRLTNSGLSITEWKPIHGVIPPLNAAEWQEEFAKYQQIPEFRLENSHMDVEAFKSIFWWEWGHRLLGRTIGLVVFLPLVFFWMTGRLERPLRPRIVTLLVLGGLQGAIGWWMVVSGLSVRTDVSQYRLAIHLTFAFVLLAYTVWLAESLRPATPGGAPPSTAVRRGAIAVLVVAFLQVFLGGLVAGLDAGLAFNTWPLMDGGIMPSGALAQSPWWRNMFENVAMVQFQHRMVAYALLALALYHGFQARGTATAGSAWILAAAIVAQAALGILTLLSVVPISLALMHQFGAAVVLIMAVAHLRSMSPPLAMPAGAAARAS